MANQRRRRIPLTIPVCSANFMKMLGTMLLTVGFFGRSVIQYGVLNSPGLTMRELNALVNESQDAFMFAGMSVICQLIGMIGIPIFSFLLAEGVKKTSNIKRYILAVFITAAAAEIPYDFAVSGRLFNWADQSFLWTLLIALVMLSLMKTFSGKNKAAVLINIMLIIGGCVWAMFFHGQFGGAFVLMTALLFLLWERRGAGIFAGVVISLIHISAPIGFIPVALYSGERKNLEKKSVKYAYYAFCPAIALIFAVTANYIVMRVSL